MDDDAVYIDFGKFFKTVAKLNTSTETLAY